MSTRLSDLVSHSDWRAVKRRAVSHPNEIRKLTNNGHLKSSIFWLCFQDAPLGVMDLLLKKDRQYAQRNKLPLSLCVASGDETRRTSLLMCMKRVVYYREYRTARPERTLELMRVIDRHQPEAWFEPVTYGDNFLAFFIAGTFFGTTPSFNLFYQECKFLIDRHPELLRGHYRHSNSNDLSFACTIIQHKVFPLHRNELLDLFLPKDHRAGSLVHRLASYDLVTADTILSYMNGRDRKEAIAMLCAQDLVGDTPLHRALRVATNTTVRALLRLIQKVDHNRHSMKVRNQVTEFESQKYHRHIHGGQGPLDVAQTRGVLEITKTIFVMDPTAIEPYCLPDVLYPRILAIIDGHRRGSSHIDNTTELYSFLCSHPELFLPCCASAPIQSSAGKDSDRRVRPMSNGKIGLTTFFRWV